MGTLDGVGLTFEESMSGFLGIGEAEPRLGAERGRRENTPIRFDVHINVDDLARFIDDPEHRADLTGTVTFAPLGGTFPLRDGWFNLFSVEAGTGLREMIYDFRFTAADGDTYHLRGHKDIHDDPGIDVVGDLTRLSTVVSRVAAGAGTPGSPAGSAGADGGRGGGAEVLYGAGVLEFRLRDLGAMVGSLRVENATSWEQRLAAVTAFASLAYGEVREEYLRGPLPIYNTQYENLVLRGNLTWDGRADTPFFLVSGTHGKGFPWGDGELFSDVLLLVGDGHGGYERYAASDRVLEGLELDVERGIYRYRGPLFRLTDGCSVSFKEMRSPPAGLETCLAELEVAFAARPFETVSFPFPVVDKLARKMATWLERTLHDRLPSEHPLGYAVTPHLVSVTAGRLTLDGASGTIRPDGTAGEAERGSFRNVTEPTLLYGYLCVPRPERGTARIQVSTRTMRNERELWAKDQLDAHLGTVLPRVASAEVLVAPSGLTVRPLPPAGKLKKRALPLRKVGEPLLEVRNDHFPTGVFLRRIVTVRDLDGVDCPALEEDITLLRLEAIDSERKVRVAAIRDDDKLAALDRVLATTGFDELLETELVKAAAEKHATRASFAIAIKPNFMFAYDRRDSTTYTDPELVHHLVRHLRARGFERISVVEAQSTYGEYFDHRSVPEVARYLGYDGSADYRLVDLTEDCDESREFPPPLGRHPVPRTWAEADLRIAFAKNKTHAYAYYTLTLKDIYGALPLANKFKEYHCDRGIDGTTIEYLAAFPVHYGLIDGHLSADGPFGIFADPAPNVTHTMIGGADLVAVDWIGASKMGIDPMISSYMRLAVQRFGKPEIELVEGSDASPYRPWLNVPVALTLFTTKGLDANYYVGNLFYTSGAQMDESYFTYNDRRRSVLFLRRLTLPVRRALFLRTGENPTVLNRLANWLFYRLGL